MALFRPKRGATGVTPPASTLSIIASGMQVTGDIRCDGVLRIDGTLEGSILGARQLLVTPGGRVRGDVQADEIVVGGAIDGNVRASVRLELQGTAVVNGNIETRAFVVPEGGRVNGDIRMLSGEGTGRAEPLRLKPPPPAPPALTEPAEPPIAGEPVLEAPTPEEPEPAASEPEGSEHELPEPRTAEPGTPDVVDSETIQEEDVQEEIVGEVVTQPRPLTKKERRKLKRNG